MDREFSSSLQTPKPAPGQAPKPGLDAALPDVSTSGVLAPAPPPGPGRWEPTPMDVLCHLRLPAKTPLGELRPIQDPGDLVPGSLVVLITTEMDDDDGIERLSLAGEVGKISEIPDHEEGDYDLTFHGTAGWIRPDGEYLRQKGMIFEPAPGVDASRLQIRGLGEISRALALRAGQPEEMVDALARVREALCRPEREGRTVFSYIAKVRDPEPEESEHRLVVVLEGIRPGSGDQALLKSDGIHTDQHYTYLLYNPGQEGVAQRALEDLDHLIPILIPQRSPMEEKVQALANAVSDHWREHGHQKDYVVSAWAYQGARLASWLALQASETAVHLEGKGIPAWEKNLLAAKANREAAAHHLWIAHEFTMHQTQPHLVQPHEALGRAHKDLAKEQVARAEAEGHTSWDQILAKSVDQAEQAGVEAWRLTTEDTLEPVPVERKLLAHIHAVKLYGTAEDAAVGAGEHGRAYDLRDLKQRHNALFEFHKFEAENPGKGFPADIYNAAQRANRYLENIYYRWELFHGTNA